MPRIFPYSKCPECGCSVLIDKCVFMITVTYQGNRKISTTSKRINNDHVLQCGKCHWTYFYKSNVTKKLVI